MTSAQRAIKRLVDITLASVLLVLASPIIAVCALMVRVLSRGPLIFRQRRSGLHGREFTLYKVRTMRTDADSVLTRHLASNSGARAEWDKYRRLADDPRLIPGIGRWLRRSSLDELPQLWNVVRGDMSLVGPRPLEVDVTERLTARDRDLRHSVRPGLTGLGQVTDRSENDIDTLVRIDSDYVQDWSLWRDVEILARTPLAVLSRRGAY